MKAVYHAVSEVGEARCSLNHDDRTGGLFEELFADAHNLLLGQFRGICLFAQADPEIVGRISHPARQKTNPALAVVLSPYYMDSGHFVPPV